LDRYVGQLRDVATDPVCVTLGLTSDGESALSNKRDLAEDWSEVVLRQ
jgi:hypothetical protein